VAIVSERKNIRQLLEIDNIKQIGVSSIVHQIFQKKEVQVSMVGLLSLLKIRCSDLYICETNHHFVNTTTEQFRLLQNWFNSCIDEATTNKTLDMGIECILFEKILEDDDIYEVPFVRATGTK
jgi:hypothetical protein|tara:strand:- start:2120 stop:2488 length:369 start_codon:yes stop_codon:yes gene_type:complete